ncbi:tRNA (adenine(58)-N(1))-methyltransferase non-catalytic subunit TRM6 [Leptopilina heterotoma]|uniref:tRNA (adenine(58)-N(1))-methyltransferase non-catalytic subunit TRM6 n=1 Tax=Leptopilina heterotoma TaxID=63436 RepID=UPI001CA9D808|nr:tRNA (adenine(58)-N(1))-methyltransferase non-catalytic subunit TRM6 [Leptopilina heterotoma]
MENLSEETMHNTNNLIKEGDYVIIRKENFMKVHRVSKNSIFTITKDDVDTSSIIGKPFWTTFEIVPSSKGESINNLQPVTKAEMLEKLRFDSLKSGVDNRLINDNGTSQQLSKQKILDLRKAGKSGKEIVQTLIENSTSFSTKTEYSQEKYIRKKGKKYFQYLTICRPTIALLQELYFRQDYYKINSIRMDTLAQIISYSDIKSDGVHLLYDSGSLGLVAASILNRIGANTSGSLINLYLGNDPQNTAVKAMNFPSDLLNRLTNLNLKDLIQSKERVAKIPPTESKEDSPEILKTEKQSTAESGTECAENKESSEDNSRKRKTPTDTDTDLESNVPQKKSKTCATNLLSTTKVDSLVIVAREHPLNIVELLINFVKKSRPFVIFHTNREPLQEIYVLLKQKYRVVNLKLFTNFLRSYQILTDRTHPDILTSSCNGYLLTGYCTQ